MLSLLLYWWDFLYLSFILAGAIAGACEALTSYPLNYAKTTLILEKGQKAKTLTTWGVIADAIRTHGLTGPYRGLSIVLLSAVPKSAVKFGCVAMLEPSLGKVPAATVAGAVSALFPIIPIDTVATKMIDDRRQGTNRFHGPFHAITVILRQEGMRGIYQGILPTMCKHMSNTAIRWPLQFYFHAYLSTFMWSVVASSVAGILSGWVSLLFTQPFDVMKTRMQGIQGLQYRNMFHCFETILQEEGALVFFRGLGPRAGRVTIENGTIFLVFPIAFQFLTWIESVLKA